MIPIQSQVAPLAQSITLKELGVEQDSLFTWTYEGEWLILQREHVNEDDCAAFTVAELGVMLDFEVFRVGKLCEDWSVDEPTVPGGFDTEAEARAAYLINLIQSDDLPIDEVNRRVKE